MIIYRQKVYSSSMTRAMYRLEKLRDKSHTKLGDRVFKKISDGMINAKNRGMDLIYPNRVDTYVNSRIAEVVPKKLSTKRRAILDKIETKKYLRRVNNDIKGTVINPGNTVNRSISTALENPISSSTQVAGKVTAMTDPSGLGSVPIGFFGLSLEKKAKDAYPAYDKFTRKSSKFYKDRLGKYVESGTNTVYNTLKGL